MSVAILEQRKDAIKLKSPEDHESLFFAKPFESFCMENVSFMFKHLNETLFQSGISTLVNNQALHDTHYKHYEMRFKNSENSIDLTFSLSYVVNQPLEALANTASLNLRKVLLSPAKSVVKCRFCKESVIKLHLLDQVMLVYSS